MIRPFEVQISDDELADLHRPLRATRWADDVFESDWHFGAHLCHSCGNWATAGSPFRLAWAIEGLKIHSVHRRSSRADAMPLILLHSMRWRSHQMASRPSPQSGGRHDWADNRGRPAPAIPLDKMIGIIDLYWFTGTAGSSARPTMKWRRIHPGSVSYRRRPRVPSSRSRSSSFHARGRNDITTSFSRPLSIMAPFPGTGQC